jgi:2-C-methyl-D-erythritol 4-phosphate cytidylyltransferase
VERLKEALSNYQAAIPVLELKESIRKRTQEGTLAANRSAFVSVQTPQCFHSEVLKSAYEQSFDEALTDDASVVERLGVSIHCVFGNEENIKITTPTELIVATHRLEHR